MAERPKL